MSFQTVPDLVAGALRDRRRAPVYRKTAARPGQPDLPAAVEELAAALHIYGLEPGAAAAVVVPPGSPDGWTGDLAVQACGGVPLLLSEETPEDRLRALLLASSARVVLVGTESGLERVLALRPDLPDLDLVLLFQPPAEDRPTPAATVAAARERGAELLAAEPDLPIRLRSVLGPASPACLWPGPAAGTPLRADHGNLAAAVRAARRALNPRAGELVLCALPPDHPAFRAAAYAALISGAEVAAVSPRPSELGRALVEVRPQCLVAVAGLLAVMGERAAEHARVQFWPWGPLVRWGLRKELARSRTALVGGALPTRKRLGDRLADAAVLRTVRGWTGGRLERIVSLGPCLPASVRDYLLGAGLAPLEGVASEAACGLVGMNRPDRIRPGTWGPPVPGLEVRAGEEGELMIRGDPVTRGVPRKGGWARTGLGGREESGFLVPGPP